MSAKFLTSVIAAGAMIATMSIATPADALNKRERVNQTGFIGEV